MNPPCEHLALAGEVSTLGERLRGLPADRRPWVHLRLCMTCGHVGCCDSSPNRHATAHCHSNPDHPIVRSYEPGEDWWWCYQDDLAFDVARGRPGAVATGKGHARPRAPPGRRCPWRVGSAGREPVLGRPGGVADPDPVRLDRRLPAYAGDEDRLPRAQVGRDGDGVGVADELVAHLPGVAVIPTAKPSSPTSWPFPAASTRARPDPRRSGAAHSSLIAQPVGLDPDARAVREPYATSFQCTKPATDESQQPRSTSTSRRPLGSVRVTRQRRPSRRNQKTPVRGPQDAPRPSRCCRSAGTSGSRSSGGRAAGRWCAPPG